jgi:peptide/nickel transport system permease protein
VTMPPPLPPSRPVRLTESLLPGLGHVRRGVRGAWRPLLYVALWLLVVVGRRDRLAGMWGTWSFENVGAFLTLLAWPVLTVWAAHLNLREKVFPRPREGMGTWALAWREFKHRSSGLWGLFLLSFLYLVAFLAPVLAPYEPDAQPPRDTIVLQNLPPGARILVLGDTKRGERYAHGWRVEGEKLVLDRGPRATAENEVKLKDLGEPRRGWFRGADDVKIARAGDKEFPYREERFLLGTDTNGRDLLSRMIYGSRISLSIGFLAMGLAVGLGIFFGAVAGYFGGWLDSAIMRFVDILMAFPRLLLLMLIITVYEGAGIWTVVLVLGLTGWMGVSRLVRAEFLRLKELDYSTAARALGYARPRIMFRHLMPNAMAPVIVSATLRVGETILVEAALSFLALGIKPPTATWGNMVDDGRGVLATAGWIATFPGLCIVLAVVCFNLVGDALRDALDPRQRT